MHSNSSEYVHFLNLLTQLTILCAAHIKFCTEKNRLVKNYILRYSHRIQSNFHREKIMNLAFRALALRQSEEMDCELCLFVYRGWRSYAVGVKVVI